MNNIVYSSLYRDAELFNLKNLVFLFDEVIIPSDSMLLIFDENSPHPDGRYITLIPDDIFDQIEFLEKEGVVKTQNLRQSFSGELPILLSAITQGTSRAGGVNTAKESIDELYDAFDLDFNNEDHSNNIHLLAASLASHSLASTLAHGVCSFSDNHVLYQLAQNGLREIVEYSALHSKESSTTQQVFSNQIISKLSDIYIPKYAFRTFEDALEAKEKLSVPIEDFRIAINQIVGFDSVDPWDPEFDYRIQEIMQRKVQPRIDSLAQSAKFSLSTIIGQTTVLSGTICLGGVLAPTVETLLVGGFGGSLLTNLAAEIGRSQQIKKQNPLGLFLYLS